MSNILKKKSGGVNECSLFITGKVIAWINRNWLYKH